MQIILQTQTSRSSHFLGSQRFDHQKHKKKTPEKTHHKYSKNESSRSDKHSLFSNKDKIESASSGKVRTAGFILLLTIVGILFAYGYASNLNTGFYNNSNNFLVGITLFLSCIFVVLGFGLYLTYYIQNLLTAIFTVLYIVSVTIILSPLVQKFWINVFLNGFGGHISSSNSNYSILYGSNSITNVSINYSNIKLSICCAISQLLLHVAVIGRMQIYKTILTSLIFIYFWNLNYVLCFSLLKISPDTRFFDDYSISMVYVFGGFAALLVSFDVQSHLHLKQTNRSLKIYPKITSLLGIFFIWMSFCCTFSIIGVKSSQTQIQQIAQNSPRYIFYPEGCIQIFFALSASTVSAYSFSYLFHGIANLQDILSGSISGAIMFGSVADYAHNIAVPIAVGIFSAFISSLYKNNLMNRLNRVRIFDSLGLFGSFLLASLLGVLATTPIIIKVYFMYSITSNTITPITAGGQSSWILIYVGISVGIGLITGMIISSFLRCVDGHELRFGDSLNFMQSLNIQEKQLDSYKDILEQK